MGKPGDYETLFSLLYSLYSVPNIFLPFFGGYFIDRLGVRTCLIVFALSITLGQLIFAIGVTSKSWPLMFLGRIIFGFGGENLGVANSAILSVWFKGKELAFAFGLNLSISRLGSVFNNLVSPTLTNDVNIQFALWFGVILCGGSVVAVLFVTSVDRHLDNMIEKSGHTLLINADEEQERDQEQTAAKNNDNQLLLGSKPPPQESFSEAPKPAGSKNASFASNTVDDLHAITEQEPRNFRTISISAAVKPAKVQFSDVKNFKQVFWILAAICVIVYGCVLPFNNIASALLLERDYFIAVPSGCHLLDVTQCQSDVNPPVDCPSSKWYQPPLPTTINVDDIDCTEDSYSKGCTEEYCNRQEDAQVEAGTIMSIPYIISACLSPFMGGFVDRFGKRAIMATLSPLALVVVHVFLGYTSVSPIGPLVGQGLAYATFAAVLWPSIAMVVEERLVGLGYGIVVSIQNLGLATFPLMIAAIYTSAKDSYIPQVEVFFVILAWIGVIIGLYLNYYDFYYLHSILNRGQKSRSKSLDARTKSETFTLINPLVFDDENVRIINPRRSSLNENDIDDDFLADRMKSSEIFSTAMIH